MSSSRRLRDVLGTYSLGRRITPGTVTAFPVQVCRSRESRESGNRLAGRKDATAGSGANVSETSEASGREVRTRMVGPALRPTKVAGPNIAQGGKRTRRPQFSAVNLDARRRKFSSQFGRTNRAESFSGANPRVVCPLAAGPVGSGEISP